MWAVLCNAVALVLVLKGGYNSLETLFKLFLGLLSISFIGSAVWVGFSGVDLLQGLFRMEMPGQLGDFDPLMVALAMIGAVGGSFMNLVYPYFLEAKGWKGPQYRATTARRKISSMISSFYANTSRRSPSYDLSARI
jgi:Mn2+/Fe2+ NRAMP family transporter